MTFEFTYHSDYVAELKGLDLCPLIEVSIDCTVEKSNYDTPLGPSPMRYNLADWKIESITTEPGECLMPHIKSMDFFIEISRKVERNHQKIVDSYVD